MNYCLWVGLCKWAQFARASLSMAVGASVVPESYTLIRCIMQVAEPAHTHIHTQYKDFNPINIFFVTALNHHVSHHVSQNFKGKN